MEKVKFAREKRRVLILYGSQTGQSKAISHALHEQLLLELNVTENDIFLATYSLDLIDRKFCIEKETIVLFIVSTTGEGEPPDNALKFWRRINKRTLPSNYLSVLNYSLLGLGDSTYNRFASFGRDLDVRLKELGAKKFHFTGFGDEAVGTEIGVEAWLSELSADLLNLLGLYEPVKLNRVFVESKEMEEMPSSLTVPSKTLSEVNVFTLPLITKKLKEIKIVPDIKLEDPPSQFCFPKLPVMDSDVVDAVISSLKRLDTTSPSEKTDKVILEAVVDITDDVTIDYQPGDSFGFICGNRDSEVNLALQKLGQEDNANKFYRISCPAMTYIPEKETLYNYIKYYTELRSVPTKSCLRCFADFCENDFDKRRMMELSSREGADEYTKFIRIPGTTILDILVMFKSCRPSLEAFFANLPCFTPRYYSVLHAKLTEQRNGFTIAFSVIRLENINCRSKSQQKGVFTGWMEDTFNRINEKRFDCLLERLSLTDNVTGVKVFKRKNPSFKLPDSETVPIVMVGPGTGIVPFIGFLEEKRKLLANGVATSPCWLFYGCRHPDQDFIYKKELDSFAAEGIITKYLVCFSRNGGDGPKYVQEIIRSYVEELFEIIRTEGSMIYVCGDTKKMPTDVFNAFVTVIEEGGNINREDAVKRLRDLQASKRYLLDLWH